MKVNRGLGQAVGHQNWLSCAVRAYILGEIYTLTMQQLTSHNARSALLRMGESEWNRRLYIIGAGYSIKSMLHHTLVTHPNAWYSL